ncbi:c-type cytochrome [Chloroflexota bacterium]
MTRSLLLITVLLTTVMMVVSCGGSQSTTTPPQNTNSTATATTWGELSIAGAQSFSANCARCHGQEGAGGIGPPNIGPSLKSFGAAQSLFDYISTRMPQFSPGSLSASTYLRILTFILTESEFVESSDIAEENNLVSVILE